MLESHQRDRDQAESGEQEEILEGIVADLNTGLVLPHTAEHLGASPWWKGLSDVPHGILESPMGFGTRLRWQIVHC